MLWRGAQAPCCRRPAGLPGTPMREVMHHRFSPLTAVVRSVWGKATQQEPALSAAPGGCNVQCSTDSMTRPTQPSPMATMLCHICSSVVECKPVRCLQKLQWQGCPCCPALSKRGAGRDDWTEPWRRPLQVRRSPAGSLVGGILPHESYAAACLTC